MVGYRRSAWALAASVLVLASCSLTTSLDGFTGGPDDDAGPPAPPPPPPGDDQTPPPPPMLDASNDVVPDVVDACDQTGCVDIPTGFSLVAYSATGGTTCPTGFTAPNAFVEGPSAGPGACTCGCTVTANPSCPTNGSIVGHFDTAGDGMCGSAGGSLTNMGCGTDGFLGPFSTGNEHRYTPPAATGGTCTSSAAKDAGKVSYTAQGHSCEASVLPECNGKVCIPSVGSGFAACLAKDGDVPCPSSFSTKHLVGSGATLSCGAGCSCGVTATCKGTLYYHVSTDCSDVMPPFSTPVDDACHATDAMGASYGSHKYVPMAAANIACTKGGSTAPSVSLTDEQTICCP
ncbi:MAG TPA: hypothetical protein VIF62_38475 [Labilithrix sp.]|jgi:hypothetical protein